MAKVTNNDVTICAGNPCELTALSLNCFKLAVLLALYFLLLYLDDVREGLQHQRALSGTQLTHLPLKLIMRASNAQLVSDPS